MGSDLTQLIKSTGSNGKNEVSSVLNEYSNIILHKLIEVHSVLLLNKSPHTLSVLNSCRVLIDSILSRATHIESILVDNKSLETFVEDMMYIFLYTHQLTDTSGLRHFMSKIRFIERNMTEEANYIYTHLVENIIQTTILDPSNNDLLHQITLGPYISNK